MGSIAMSNVTRGLLSCVSRTPGCSATWSTYWRLHWIKARVLREVRERMREPCTATSNDTVGMLSCLLSFEMSSGSVEALTHLHGLKSIIAMKGGLHALDSDGIATTLETLDLLHAILFDTDPILSEPEFSRTATFGDQQTVDIRSPAPIVSLLKAEQQQFQRSNTAYAARLRQLPALLTTLADLFDTVSTDAINPNREHPKFHATQQCRRILEELGQPGPEQHSHCMDALHLARASHLCWTILWISFVYRTPYRHHDNQRYTNELVTTLHFVPEHAWQDLAYLRLWVVLSGAATSNDPAKKSYFKAQLVRAIYRMGPSEYRRIKAFIWAFIEIRAILEQRSKQATPTVEQRNTKAPSLSYLYPASPASRRSSPQLTIIPARDAEWSQHRPCVSRRSSPVSWTESTLFHIPRSHFTSLFYDPSSEPLSERA